MHCDNYRNQNQYCMKMMSVPRCLDGLVEGQWGNGGQEKRRGVQKAQTCLVIAIEIIENCSFLLCPKFPSKMLILFLLLILKYHLIIPNIIQSSSSCCFACIKEVSKVLFLYKQVGTEGGMYKAFYKQFIKKVILMQDYL